jgi:trehalose synthase-fused probable maltokinase
VSSGLLEQVTEQRWYGAKSRSVSQAEVLDRITVREADPELTLALAELRYDTGAHDVYQVLLSGTETDLARELVSAMRSKLTLLGAEGAVEFHTSDGFMGLDGELGAARPVDSEQSNTSVVFDDALILKLFRRLEAGVNPELELLRFLGERDFPNVPVLGGWYEYSGGPLTATLGLLQEFVADGVDGWQLALDEIATAPTRFLDRIARLGEVTAELHNALASDLGDPAFCPEDPSSESLALLTATVDEEIVRLFLALPEDDESLEPIAGRREEVRQQLHTLSHVGSAGRVIRTHGDFHLGQTLVSGDDWMILDFEGEPARTLAERRRKQSPLRDVAGMLRSFAYAANAAEILHGVAVPEDWEQQARKRFLESYLDVVDAVLLPAGEPAIGRLLAMFELEKAVYELRYELDNRPDWVPISVAGIERLLHTTAEVL